MLSVDSVAWGGVYGRGIARFRNSVPPLMPTLTELKVRAAKAAEKPYKLYDERGLFMLVTVAGGRLWRFKYRVGGVEKLLTLGIYPDVSLKRAREKRDDARRALADGIDLGAKRRAKSDAKTNTFLAVADEWLLTKKASLTESTWERDRQQVQPLWRVPAERMKMREAHIVPLARQSVEILRALQPITGRQQYVFPAIGRDGSRSGG